MTTLLKFIIIVISAGFFIYCAGLAFQGELDMETILRDIKSLFFYCINLLEILLQRDV